MDFAGYLQFLLALIFVIGLIGACALLLRRLAPAMQGVRRPGGARRLEVLEVLPIDARRRLVMVRRDDAAHLLLIGINDDRVVETGFAVEDPMAGRVVPRPEGADDAADGMVPTAPRAGGFKRIIDHLQRGGRPTGDGS
jgi:flagellar protein FliO/FliZ